MEKIDIMNSQYQYEKALDSLSNLSNQNQILIKKFIEANSLGQTAIKKRKQAGIRALTKNLYLLKIAVRFFEKSLDKLTKEDVENLIKSLNQDKLLKQNGKKYSEQTKANIKKVLIMFLRFALKDMRKYEGLTSWIDTGFKKKEISALTEDEIKKLLSACNTLKQKVLIAGLFDSGCRIEEFLNIRRGDLVKVESDLPYYKLTIRTEFSKTKGRTFGLFWKETTRLIDEWLELNSEKLETDVFFDSTYDGVRKILSKLGKRALKKSVNPHLFRHSSATYYAGQGMDYFQLCMRYGWTIGSDVPKIYIDRSGIKDKEFAEKTSNKRIDELTKEVETFKLKEKVSQENNNQIKDQLEELKEKMIQVIEMSIKGKNLKLIPPKKQ